jgi:hypothetical protein
MHDTCTTGSLNSDTLPSQMLVNETQPGNLPLLDPVLDPVQTYLVMPHI